VRGGAGGELLTSPVFYLLISSRGVGCYGDRQEAERAYLLWKARQVADQQGSGAVAVVREEDGEEGEAKEALVDFALHRLKGDLFPDLMEYMG
jgi:hypothetical protein